MRLLLVEDDPMIGESVRTGLQQDGFALDWVQDGRAAELALQTNRVGHARCHDRRKRSSFAQHDGQLPERIQAIPGSVGSLRLVSGTASRAGLLLICCTASITQLKVKRYRET